MTRWEYNTVIVDQSSWLGPTKLKAEAFQQKLAELGAEGWELVSMIDTNRAGGGTMELIAVFKRPLR